MVSDWMDFKLFFFFLSLNLKPIFVILIYQFFEKY